MVYLKKLLCFVCVALAQFSYGQIAFFKNYGTNGYDYAEGVVELPDSSYIICGSSSGFQDAPSDAFLLKLNKNGEFLWSNHYGTEGADGAKRILCVDSMFYLIGWTNASVSGDYDVFVVKTNWNGDELWKKQYQQSGWQMVTDAEIIMDSLVVFTGKSSTSNTDDFDWFLQAIDTSGSVKWQQQGGGTGDDVLNGLAYFSDSTMYAVGTTFNVDSTLSKGLFVKCYTNGSIAWQVQMGPSGAYALNDLFFNGGQIRLIGSKENILTGELDGVAIWSDYAGNYWGEPTTTDDGDAVLDHVVAYGDSTNTYVASHFRSQFSTANSYDVYITRYTNVMYWDAAYVAVNSSLKDQNNALIRTRDGGAIAVGYTERNNWGGAEAYILKIGPDDLFPVVDLTTTNSILSVKEIPIFSGYLYPNPVKETVCISGIDAAGQKLEVYSIFGNLVMDTMLDAQSVDVSHLPAGIYVLKIQGIQKRFLKL